MATINSSAELRNSILQLEAVQANEVKLLKTDFQDAYKSIQPFNIIKNTFKKAAKSDDLKQNIVNTSIGLGTGMILKLLFNGVTKGPVNKIIGNAVMFGITTIVSKNPELIKTAGNNLLHKIFHKPVKNQTGQLKDEAGS